MNVETMPITAEITKLQTLQQACGTGALPPMDAALVQLCDALEESQNGDLDVDVLIQRIADTPATSRVGLRAKALALRALLDDGDGSLYEDASTPDLLAWSLVQDILAD
jgi:uncharacterized protein with von Willebrand factor type A (vWA) domain